MGKLKKLVLLILTAVSGLLLTLAGLNLIQLTPQLILYSGLALLLVSVLIYFFN